jgi:vacuolar-type H+-ATPase subunit H
MDSTHERTARLCPGRANGLEVHGRAAMAVAGRRSHRVAARPCVGPGPPVDVLTIIDKLDDLVHKAKQVPLRDQVRVDREEVYEILDQMRATIPEDIKQARWIVKERQELLAAGKREAERILEGAGERQTQLVSQHEVIRQAELAAEGIIEDARAREREIRLGAEDYAEEILYTLEVNLSKFIAAVQRGRERLQGPDDPAGVG